MTPLNTITEEEKEKARKQFDDSPVSLRIDALERYAHVHGWSQFEGRTIQDEIDTIVTTAIQRAYEAGREERDTYWKERVRKKFIPWEKIEILDNGAIMTIDNKVRLYGFKRMTDPLMYEYDLRKGNQALDTLLDNLK